MATEFEIKFAADPRALAAIRADFPGGNRIAMETTYYDTPDRNLGPLRWTLRHRSENERHVCTLKTPADSGLARGEFETDCPEIQKAVPVLAVLSGHPELEKMAEKGLIPVCGAKFQRIAVVFSMGETVAELALDEGVLRNGEKTAPLCECEIELKEGDRRELLLYAKHFAAKYHLVQEPRSKFARALALGKE